MAGQQKGARFRQVTGAYPVTWLMAPSLTQPHVAYIYRWSNLAGDQRACFPIARNDDPMAGK